MQSMVSMSHGKLPVVISSPDFATWVSETAQARFADSVVGQVAPVETTLELRRHYARLNQARLDIALTLYDVDIETSEIAGVVVHKVRRRACSASDTRRLICLHGGGFMWGEGPGALIEAVPVAAVSGIPVIAIEYRMAPECRFPAASDDVVSVYHALRKHHSPAALGLYGCSAGAILTSQVVARLLKDGTPVPGAIAMLHAVGLELGGDSLALGALLNGLPINAPEAAARLSSLDYLSEADPKDALVFPGNHPDILSRFPPSLLVTGTRDFAASATSVMHRRLRAAGAISDFVLFDGMWHAHHVDTDLPEARETFDLLSRFFAEHLRP